MTRALSGGDSDFLTAEQVLHRKADRDGLLISRISAFCSMRFVLYAQVLFLDPASNAAKYSFLKGIPGISE